MRNVFLERWKRKQLKLQRDCIVIDETFYPLRLGSKLTDSKGPSLVCGGSCCEYLMDVGFF